MEELFPYDHCVFNICNVLILFRFLDENVMIVGQDIFIAHDWVHTKGNIQCAENIICSLNEHSVTKSPLQNKVNN